MSIRQTMIHVETPYPALPHIPLPGSRQGHWAHDVARASFVQHVVAIAFGVAPREIVSTTRGNAAVCVARQAAMYLTHVGYELSLTRVAQAFGRDRTTVSHACHQIEDMRDDAAFDEQMEALCVYLRSAPMFGAGGA